MDSTPSVPTASLPILPLEQPQIKYESPYSAEPPQYDPNASALKRRYSETVHNGLESDEKRRRIEPEQSFNVDDMDFAAMIAQAAATAAQETGAGMPDYSQQHHDPMQAHHSFSGSVQNHQPMPQQPDYTRQSQRPEASSIGFSNDPHLYMRICSLPILESLSTQLLATLAQGPYSETINIVTKPETDLGQAYQTLKSLFDQTKKIYSQTKPFLSANGLNIQEVEHRSTIRITNLATFASSVFGGQDVGFYELNDHFLECFVPDGGEFGKDPGQLYLNLKTQMFLSAISAEETEMTADETLENLFPQSLADALCARHPGMDLTASEQDFISAANARKAYLQNEAGDADTISALSEQYAWEDFLRSLSDHLKFAYAPLLAPYMRRHALNAPAPSVHVPPPQHRDSVPDDSTDIPTQTQSNEPELDLGDIDIEAATRDATQQALQSIGYNQYNTDPNQQQQQNQAQQQQQQQQQRQQQQHMQQMQHHPPQHPPQMNGYPQHPQPYPPNSVPYHTQTAPTQVLYEQARQAAVAKASPHSRRPGLPSQRRPWSTEEENALMAGLDQVKGPHWSQILALYGSKGQVSEILKDRNQVQLKDKARNLKLFFLKSNIEVPYYLQCVTGELKTRAPSQAARKEAEERARLQSDEETARFHGIMALAGGMQQHDPNIQHAHPPPQGLEIHGSVDHHGHQLLDQSHIRRQDSMEHQQHHSSGDGQYHEDPSRVNAVGGHSQHSSHGTATPMGQMAGQQSLGGVQGIGGGGQPQSEVSQSEFEDQLGARLMESLEDHDKGVRAASEAS